MLGGIEIQATAHGIAIFIISAPVKAVRSLSQLSLEELFHQLSFGIVDSKFDLATLRHIKRYRSRGIEGIGIVLLDRKSVV